MAVVVVAAVGGWIAWRVTSSSDDVATERSAPTSASAPAVDPATALEPATTEAPGSPPTPPPTTTPLAGPGTRCGAVPTEDGPIDTVIINGNVDCTEVLDVLGALLGGSNDRVSGDPDGWTVTGASTWSCTFDDTSYRCDQRDGLTIGTVPSDDGGADDSGGDPGSTSAQAGETACGPIGPDDQAVFVRGITCDVAERVLGAFIDGGAPWSWTCEGVQNGDVYCSADGASITDPAAFFAGTHIRSASGVTPDT